MKNSYNDREVRMECIKMATMVAMQLKLSADRIEPMAERFYAFATKEEQDESSPR